MSTAIKRVQWKLRHSLPSNKHVVAIDIGTTRTCIASSRVCEVQEELVTEAAPCMKAFPPHDAHCPPESDQKTLTAMLLDAAGQRKAFGYSAEDKFANEYEEGDVLCKHYKMVLKDACGPMEAVMALSVDGVEVPLMQLLVQTMEHARDTALEDIRARDAEFAGANKGPLDVLWALTVPAGWSDYAKAFMRKAAWKAGLVESEDSRNLVLCYEPEGGCLGTILAEQRLFLGGGSRIEGQQGPVRFVVVDAGGGTVDVTAHELESLQPLALKDVVRPQMDAEAGSTQIDNNFQSWLVKEFLSSLSDTLKSEVVLSPHMALYVMRDFEAYKRRFTGGPHETFRLDLSSLANEVIKPKDGSFDLHARVLAWNESAAAKDDPSKQVSMARLAKTSIILRGGLMASFFEPVLARVVRLVKGVRDAMMEAGGCNMIICVGGFGESKLLVQALRDHLSEDSKHSAPQVITSRRPSLAIARGAVLYAITDSIVARVMQRSYGLEVLTEYQPWNKWHVAKMIERLDGVDRVPAFGVLVRKGESIPVDKRLPLQGSFSPVMAQQTEIDLKFLVSEDDAPEDKPAELCGVVRMEVDQSRPLGCREFLVELRVAETELKAAVIDAQTGILLRDALHVDFLQEAQ